MTNAGRVLITGFAGSLARLVGKDLADRGYQIFGADYRPVEKTIPFARRIYQASYNKTAIEDVFRQTNPTHVIHLGRASSLKTRANKRFDLNVLGSHKIMQLCLRYHVRRLVVFSTFHIYGAHPHNHTPIDEDDPVRAGSHFPEIADAIQLDSHAVEWSYRYPELKTIVLRPCNVIGSEISNEISRFIRRNQAILMLGFDPIMQFIDQSDMVSALLAAVEGNESGVFNIAGLGVIPLSEVYKISGARRIFLPSPLVALYLKGADLVSHSAPSYLLNFLKYPCVISNERFRRKTGWYPQVGQAEAIRLTLNCSG